MKLFISRLSVLTMLTFGLLSCAEQQNSLQQLRSQNPQLTAGSELQLMSSNRFVIVDETAQPISNATILVGYEPGNPFNGNTLTTDAAGIAEVPADWKAALPITVQAPGYVTTSIPTVMPGDVQIRLNKQEGSNEIEVGGTATDFGRIVTDGKVDFALLIPALSRENLLAFDMSSVISPKTDRITIIGNNVDIPTNISLPRQTENYIFPIELNKPDYRVFFRDPGQYMISATHGQFPLQKVVNDIRAGKSIFDVINHFTFIEGSTQTVNVTGNMTGINMPVNTTKFTGNVSVTAPPFDASQVMVALVTSEKNGLMTPTDLKRFTTGQAISMKSDTAATTNVLSLLLENTTNAISSLNDWFAPWLKQDTTWTPGVAPMATTQDLNKLSFAFLPATAGGVAPQFLPLIAKPVVNGNIITLEVPTLPARLTALATYLVYSEIETVGSGNATIERRTRLWELWSKTWLPQVELPQITFARKPNMKYRWEVMFLAGPGNIVGDLTNGQTVDLNTVTHVTRNAADL